MIYYNNTNKNKTLKTWLFISTLFFFVFNNAHASGLGNFFGTNIHGAARQGKLKTIKNLVEKKGANVNQKDKRGNTALHFVAWKGHYKVAKYLIEKGANVDIQDGFGQTALQLSATWGHPEIVKLLISNNAKLELKNNEGKTALIRAASSGQREIVDLLIDAGSNVSVVDNNSKNALDYALTLRDDHESKQPIVSTLKLNVGRSLKKTNDVAIQSQNENVTNEPGIKQANNKARWNNKKYSILGFNLGQILSNIRLPDGFICNKPNPHKIADVLTSTYIECRGKDNINDTVQLIFDYKNKLTSVERERMFHTSPYLDKVNLDIIKKYGKPFLHGTSQTKTGEIKEISFCWINEATGCKRRKKPKDGPFGLKTVHAGGPPSSVVTTGKGKTFYITADWRRFKSFLKDYDSLANIKKKKEEAFLLQKNNASNFKL